MELKDLRGTATSAVDHGLALVRARARRADLIGEMAYRGLDLFHGSLQDVSSAIARLERASRPPARPGRPVNRVAKTSAVHTKARRTAGRATTPARRGVDAATA